MSEESDNITLPFSDQKQVAVLGHLLYNDSFFRQSWSKIRPGWFVDSAVSKVWDAKIAFYKKYGRGASVPELKETEAFLLEDAAVKSRMETLVAKAQLAMEDFGLDTIKPELTTWLQTTMYFSGAKQAEKFFNLGKFPESFAYMKKTLKEIDEATFENEYEADFSNYEADFMKAQEERKNALTFGSKLLDALLLPEADGAGCLLPGDTTVIVAPTNVGKTTCAITAICANIKRGKYVLFILTRAGSQTLRRRFGAVSWASARASYSSSTRAKRARRKSRALCGSSNGSSSLCLTLRPALPLKT